MKSCALLLAMLASVLIPERASSQQDPAWTTPFPAFRIADNLYYVGTKGLASYLITKGVPSVRVEANGRGESEPIQPNDTEAGRSANRRVEVAVFAGDQMKADAKKQAGPPPRE